MIDGELPVGLSIRYLTNHGFELGDAQRAGADVSDGDRITNRGDASCRQVSVVMSGGGFYGPANPRARRHAALKVVGMQLNQTR